MAIAANDKQLEKIKKAHETALAKKIESQEKQGKWFELDAYGPGVIPEAKWKQMKKDGSDSPVEDYEVA